MELTFTEEQNTFRQSVAEFVAAEVTPVAEKQDRSGEFPRNWFRKCGELGYLGVRYPHEIGGSDLGFTSYCILCEEIARGSLSMALTVAMQCLMGTDFVFRLGTQKLKEKLLRPAITGEKISAFALTELDAGSDLGAIRTTVKREGDEYVLDGNKTWVTNSSVADFFVVLATRNPDLGTDAVDFFLVEKDAPGLTVGRDIQKVGTRGSVCGKISLRNCRIPAENALGEKGTGLANMKEILSQVRVMMGALALGLSRAAFEEAGKYSVERVAFGRPIGKFQAIRHKLVDMALDIHIMHMLVYNAATRVEKGARLMKESAMVKLFSTEAANRCADNASRIFASYGYDMDHPVQRYFRDARFLLIGGGTPELLKNIIAKEL